MMAEDMIREDVEDIVLGHTCDQCGKTFESIQGLNGHKMSHVPGGACPDCGRDNFATMTSLARHRSIAHGVMGADKARTLEREAAGKPKRVRAAAVDSTLSVDHIFQSVIQTLYPHGQMPTKAMVPLMEWREATQKLLETVRGD
jgi:predicted  nucleic acid-binding Zn-ribbon protein